MQFIRLFCLYARNMILRSIFIIKVIKSTTRNSIDSKKIRIFNIKLAKGWPFVTIFQYFDFFHYLYVYLMQMPLFNLISNIWLIIMQSMLRICECEQFFCSNLIWCIKAISLMAPNKRHPHTRIDLEIVHILQCFQVAYNGAHCTKWSICLIQLKSNKINAMNMRVTNG